MTALSAATSARLKTTFVRECVRQVLQGLQDSRSARMGGARGAIPGVCRGDMWMKSSDLEAISEGRERRTSATTHGARVSSTPWTSRHLDEAKPRRSDERSGIFVPVWHQEGRWSLNREERGLQIRGPRISREERVAPIVRKHAAIKNCTFKTHNLAGGESCADCARACSWEGLHTQDPAPTRGRS